MRHHARWRCHLDEVYVKINGEMRCLRRAVCKEGEVLESFFTNGREEPNSQINEEGPQAPRLTS